MASEREYAPSCGACRACFIHHDVPIAALVTSPVTSYISYILCAICGNKRCPHATDHRLDCTGSNEPNQPGSSYQQRYFGDEAGTPPAPLGPESSP